MFYHKPVFLYKFFLNPELVLHHDSHRAMILQNKKNQHLIPQIMKKAALTFGLFSLVMVATSFATPETTNFLTASDSIKIVPVDGGATGKQKKGDQQQVSYTSRQLNFASVNQSIGTDKKVD
jgi:hypothetical protein